MSNNNQGLLGVIIPAMGDRKHSILTNEASTIVEKYKNPKTSSVKKHKKIKDIISGGKAKLSNVVAESISRPANGKDLSLEKYVKNTVEKVAPKHYEKKDGKRFSQYLGVKSPKESSVTFVDEGEIDDDVGETRYSVIMNEFGEAPVITLSACDVKELDGFMAGDYFETEFKGEITNFSYEGKDDGSERYIYNLVINGYAMEDSEE